MATSNRPSRLRWTFLGTGTSAGVPIVACDCAVCRSEDPHDHRLRCSSCLEFTDESGHDRILLFDTSPDLREQALRHHLMRCDGIFFTHHHVDHLWGLDEVRRFNAVMQEAINIYAEDRTMENIMRVYPHIFRREENANDSFVATLNANLLEVERAVDLFGLRIMPIRLMHGRLPIMGFRIDEVNGDDLHHNDNNLLPLAYCTDVSGIPPETWQQLTGLKTLILDMLRPRHHPTHLNVNQAVKTAESIGAEQTYFIHMTHDILHADLDEQLPTGMHLAYDGLVLGEPADSTDI